MLVHKLIHSGLWKKRNNPKTSKSVDPYTQWTSLLGMADHIDGLVQERCNSSALAME